MCIKAERTRQLGMNPATAASRVAKDMLHKLAVEAGYKCYQCGGELQREGFSIEHKIPYLHSEDPIALFFDLDNVAFSHLLCNSKAGRPSNWRDKLVD